MKELDYTNEKIKELEDQEIKRQKDIVQSAAYLDKNQTEYKSELKKWHIQANLSKLRFEKLLKMYMANGDSLEGVKFDFNKIVEDPEFAQKEQEKKELREKMDKDIRNNQLHINRMRGELQTKTVDIQRICTKYK
jgi:hypothetical protein